MFWYEDQYCKVNFYLFSLYSGMDNIDVTTRVVGMFLSVMVLMGGVISQSLVFVVQGASLHVIMDVIPGGLATIAAISTLIIFYYNKTGNTQLLYMVEDFYKEDDCEDVTMMRENSVKIIKRIIKFITIAAPLGATGMFSLTFTPLVFDVIAPLNESRPLELTFAAEFFVDKHKYFYFLVCYQFVGTCIIVIIIGSLLNVVILALLSTGAYFRGIGYHLQSIRSMADQQEKMSNERLVHEKLVLCVMKHRKVVELVWLINQCGEWLIFMGLSVTIIVFSLSAVQVMDPETFELKILLFTIAQLVDVFIGCLLGQHIIDVSSNLADKLYDSRWYECPARLQKLLLIILMRSQQPAVIAFKGLMVLCNKSLGSILQTAMSYVMVLRQFQ